MKRKEQRIFIDDETHEKLKKKSEELGMSISEIVRQSTEYVEKNDIDICEDLRYRDELLTNLRQKLINRFGTLAEAAKQLGVSYWTIRKYCRKEFYPSKSIMTKLSRMLGQKL